MVCFVCETGMEILASLCCIFPQNRRFWWEIFCFNGTNYRYFASFVVATWIKIFASLGYSFIWISFNLHRCGCCCVSKAKSHWQSVFLSGVKYLPISRSDFEVFIMSNSFCNYCFQFTSSHMRVWKADCKVKNITSWFRFCWWFSTYGSRWVLILSKENLIGSKLNVNAS